MTSELRLLSWNVRSLRDGREAVAAVIRDAGVDVALLQEAPRFLRWRSKRAALAREAGLVVGTADRVGGLVVLTSMRTWVLDHDHQPLPPSGGRHRRAVVTATVSVAQGPRWRLAVTHLGLVPGERVQHARQVNAVLRTASEPLVLAADVNDEPGSPAWEALGDGLVDCFHLAETARPTFPATRPSRRIDAVFASPALAVADARVLDVPPSAPPSDHLPLLVTLRAAG